MGDYLYVGGDAASTSPYKIPILKIKKSDMSIDATLYLDGASGELVSGLCQDSNFLYATDSATKKLFKISKEDFEIVDESEAFSTPGYHLVHDLDFVYVALKWEKKVVKIKKSDMSVVETSDAVGNYITTMTSDSLFLYIGTEGECKVYKMAKSDLGIECSIAPFRPVSYYWMYEEVLGLVVVGDKVYVTCTYNGWEKDDTYYILDKSDLSLEGSFKPSSTEPWRMIYDSGYLYTFDNNTKKMHVVDVELEEIADSSDDYSEIPRFGDTDLVHFYFTCWFSGKILKVSFDDLSEVDDLANTSTFNACISVEQYPPPDPTDPSFPSKVFDPRQKANDSSAEYDPLKDTIIYVEDIKRIENEIIAVQEAIGVGAVPALGSILDRLNKLEE